MRADRRCKRNQQRLAYEAFGKVFGGEKRYQQYLLSSEENVKKLAQAHAGAGRKAVVKAILNGQPLLGKKLPLRAWVKAVAEAKDRQAKETATKAETETALTAGQEEDTEWRDA